MLCTQDQTLLSVHHMHHMLRKTSGREARLRASSESCGSGEGGASPSARTTSGAVACRGANPSATKCSPPLPRHPHRCTRQHVRCASACCVRRRGERPTGAAPMKSRRCRCPTTCSALATTQATPRATAVHMGRAREYKGVLGVRLFAQPCSLHLEKGGEALHRQKISIRCQMEVRAIHASCKPHRADKEANARRHRRQRGYGSLECAGNSPTHVKTISKTW